MLFAQKKTEYAASNGITYHIGDTIKLGRGSDPQGSFRYVQMGGWGKILTGSPTKGSSQYNMDREFTGTGAIIKKMRTDRVHKLDRQVFVVGIGALTNCDMFIEDAIATCEIADCKKSGDPNANASSVLSPADELAKYKKLLDQGAITKEEYDAKKKKILNQ